MGVGTENSAGDIVWPSLPGCLIADKDVGNLEASLYSPPWDDVANDCVLECIDGP